LRPGPSTCGGAHPSPAGPASRVARTKLNPEKPAAEAAGRRRSRRFLDWSHDPGRYVFVPRTHIGLPCASLPWADRFIQPISSSTSDSFRLSGGAMAIEIGSASKTSPEEVLQRARAAGVKVVDVRFVDLPGTWQHFSLPLSAFDEDAFTEGLGFDGSSI